MPKLCRYVDGRGYYLRGSQPATGICTWQIGTEGLAYLSARGMAADGGSVSVETLSELLRHGLVHTNGTGTTPVPPWTEHSTAPLIAWARNGDIHALGEVLGPTQCVSEWLLHCFPQRFLIWLHGLDPNYGLSRLAGISAAEFDSLGTDTLAELSDDSVPLLKHLIDQRAVEVLRRLARIAGSVAVKFRASPRPPSAWAHDEVLNWLFAEVKKCHEESRKPDRSGGRIRKTSWKAPYIVWETDLQEVKAILPAQLLPPKSDAVEWRVSDRPTVFPPVLSGPKGKFLDKSDSPPLPPSAAYGIDLKASGTAAEGMHWDLAYPADAPILLFRTDGRSVDSKDPDPIAPARYLGLVRPGRAAEARSIPGVDMLEPVDVPPVGWHGWTGWNLQLRPGALLPGYRTADSNHDCGWELEPEADRRVSWLEEAPVFSGDFPRLRLSAANTFRGAVLEVEIGGPAGPSELVYFTLGADLAIRCDGTAGVVDPNGARRLQSRYGRFRMRCHLEGQLDRVPLDLSFTRLPRFDLGRIADPVHPEIATALRIGSNPALSGATAGPNTEFLEDGAGLILRAIDPVSDPAVRLRSAGGDWEFGVRIGVTRAALIDEKTGFRAWQPIPIKNLGLAQIALADRLRVEFHSPPVVEGGHLVSRLPGRAELLVGAPLGSAPEAYVFEIPLHRWRDGFGSGSCGIVQIRAASGWIDIAELGPCSKEAARSIPLLLPELPWQIAKAELEQAVRNGNSEMASILIDRCLDLSSGANVSRGAADLLPLAAAEASLAVRSPAEWAKVRDALRPLENRDDLPEARLLAASMEVRGGGSSGSNKWSHARVETLTGKLPDCPASYLVRAECWYRFARSCGGGADGCWRACRDAGGRLVDSNEIDNGQAVSDAMLLRHFARMMLGENGSADIRGREALPGNRGWIEAARAAGRFVRQPLKMRPPAEKWPALDSLDPTVLDPQDAALLRFLVGLAAQRSDLSEIWALVDRLPEGYFYALPLLRARYARHTGNPRTDELYAKAWENYLRTGRSEMMQVVADERP